MLSPERFPKSAARTENHHKGSGICRSNRFRIRDMKRFTIITVCLNTEKEIKGTIQSVLEQDYDDFEYLIKDGGSTDRTLEVAESFVSDFEKRGIPYRIISSPDSGIYDAMNQATQEARGEWLLFMNAGDRFAGKTVLSLVESSGKLDSAEIVYGDRILKYEDLYCYDKARALEEIQFCLPFGHQSAFTRRAVLEQVPFSLQYRICSDYLFYMQMYTTEGKKFAYLPVAVSIFDMNGISANAKFVHQEKLKIFEQMPVRNEEAIQREKELLKRSRLGTFWHEHFGKYVPQRLREMRRRQMKIRAGWKREEEFFAGVK